VALSLITNVDVNTGDPNVGRRLAATDGTDSSLLTAYGYSICPTLTGQTSEIYRPDRMPTNLKLTTSSSDTDQYLNLIILFAHQPYRPLEFDLSKV
jgi:hypothetical protein